LERLLSRADRRYKCTTCGRTFAATRGTPYYRKRTAHNVITLALSLLTHGCPLQAIVAAFGFDERTVAAWQEQAGRQSQEVHAQLVQRGQVDLQHVQADELWVKMVGRRVWMAYNFCWEHESLRRQIPEGGGRKWQGRTPAMAAGLTDRRWTMHESLSHRVPPPPWVAPKRRGRPPKPKEPLDKAVAA
jgi:hypothetical protein